MELRIGATGNVGGWGPAINALAEAVAGFVGGGSLGDMNDEVGARGMLAESPMPSCGYLGSGEFYYRIGDGDFVNDWVVDTLGELMYTDRQRGATGTKTPIRLSQPRETFDSRYRMRYTNGIRLKASQWGKMAEPR